MNQQVARYIGIGGIWSAPKRHRTEVQKCIGETT